MQTLCGDHEDEHMHVEITNEDAGAALIRKLFSAERARVAGITLELPPYTAAITLDRSEYADISPVIAAQENAKARGL